MSTIFSDSVKNAAIRLRMVVSNREKGATPTEQREWDDRVLTAEVHLEAALLSDGTMKPEDAIASIDSDYPDRVIVYFETGESLTIVTRAE